MQHAIEGGVVAAVAPVEVSYQQLLDQSLDLSAEIEKVERRRLPCSHLQ